MRILCFALFCFTYYGDNQLIAAAAAMVWRICLPNRHEEHRFICSVGIVDVRITIAWIYSEAEKEAEQKASAMRNEMALAVGSRRWLMSRLVCLLSYLRLKPNRSIELQNVQVSDTTEAEQMVCCWLHKKPKATEVALMFLCSF